MGLLDRFFGNDLQLTRPDFKRFRHIGLDFTGTKIRFIDAAHNAMFPINDWPSDLDIYSYDDLDDYEDGSFGKVFYVRGWDFFGKKNQARGGCKFSSYLCYFPNKHPENVSYFSRLVLEREVIDYCHNTWGWINPDATPGSLGPEARCFYPVDVSELAYETINGIHWCRFVVQKKGRAPEVHYVCPISRHHILFASFKFYAYDGLDYYSPETNLEQTCNDVMHDIMSDYFIELSPRSQAERAQADDPV